jgi:hypothetical protein
MFHSMVERVLAAAATVVVVIALTMRGGLEA